MRYNGWNSKKEYVITVLNDAIYLASKNGQKYLRVSNYFNLYDKYFTYECSIINSYFCVEKAKTYDDCTMHGQTNVINIHKHISKQREEKLKRILGE